MRRERKIHLGITDDLWEATVELSKKKRFAPTLREALQHSMPSEPPQEESKKIIATMPVAVPEDLYSQAEKLGQEWGIGAAGVLREALRRYLNGTQGR